jgi:hypothetical protein
MNAQQQNSERTEHTDLRMIAHLALKRQQTLEWSFDIRARLSAAARDLRQLASRGGVVDGELLRVARELDGYAMTNVSQGFPSAPNQSA